jgi:energy-coupling factor transporter ATP-binding protein EcfA2
MKITKIEVSDFRGFPGPAVYDFEFGQARSLFIWGENGSGKSSLFRAIQEFFNTNRGAKPFADHKNTNDPALTSGHVTVHFEDGTIQTTQAWQHGGDRPVSQPPCSQTALQVGCLDYRSLLETNFTQRGNNVNLFHIAVTHLVPNVEVPVQGGSKRIGQLWQTAKASDPSRIGHYRSRLESCDRALLRFNDGFQPLIQPLIDKASELLTRFNHPELTLGAASQPVAYDRGSRAFRNTDLILSVHRAGIQIQDHHNVLNEARLSAIGLVVYLAGLLITVPGTSPFPKLLVLDDVLIGLDMANRMPVLKILADYFADWQIVLLTHDRVWYEMVQVEMTGNQWRGYELWLDEDGVTPIHRARDGGPDFFLSRAKQHLVANDDRASAVYTRAAFEIKVKGYCDKKSVAVPYKKEPRLMKIDSFWQAAKVRAIAIAANPGERQTLSALFQAVDAAQRVVLNPLSHSITQPVTKPEIQAAITAVENLRFE